jgi:hypothetical protein
LGHNFKNFKISFKKYFLHLLYLILSAAISASMTVSEIRNRKSNPIKANANPVAAHDPSTKRRPNCQLFVGFALKTSKSYFDKHLLNLLYLIMGAAISAYMNCVGKTKPQMDADTRRCDIQLRRMTPATKGAPAVSYLWALL